MEWQTRAIEVWAEVAKRRADDELARWYAQHSSYTAPASTSPPAAPWPTAPPVSATSPTVPQQRVADPAAQPLASSIATRGTCLMDQTGAKLLSFYLVIDGSWSMTGSKLDSANRIMSAIVDALAKNPILSDKVRCGLIDFSDDAQVRLPLCDLREPGDSEGTWKQAFSEVTGSKMYPNFIPAGSTVPTGM